MSKKSRPSQRLLLTDRCLQDIATIERLSVERWGRKTANKYLRAIEEALKRIEANPELLRKEEGFHEFLRFYRVNKHVLVCDLGADEIIVLTVFHSSMDIPSRLVELEPTLATEVEFLHQKLRKTMRNKG